MLIEKPSKCLENDSQIELEPDDFPKDEDSTIYISNKTKGTKLESQFQRKTSTITDESKHTITMKDKKGKSQKRRRQNAWEKTPKKADHIARKQNHWKRNFQIFLRNGAFSLPQNVPFGRFVIVIHFRSEKKLKLHS